MNLLSILILIGIIVWFILAVIHIVKHKGCGCGGCGSHSSCGGCQGACDNCSRCSKDRNSV